MSNLRKKCTGYQLHGNLNKAFGPTFRRNLTKWKQEIVLDIQRMLENGSMCVLSTTA